MEELLSKTNSIPSLLVMICVIGVFHIILKIGEFLWDLIKKKNELSEQTVLKLTTSVEHLENTLKEIQKDISEMPKFRTDLRRLFSAVKHLAGDDWTEIRKEIMGNDFDV